MTAIHVYFPDPWWKVRHQKRRIFTPRFVKDVERILCPAGEFHFWSDVREYFESALVTIKEHSTLGGPFDVPEAEAAHDMDYRTHFERRMRARGIDVYRAKFRKPA